MPCTPARASAPLSRCEVSYQNPQGERKEECLEHVRYGDQEGMFRLRNNNRPKGSGTEVASYVISGFLLRVNKD